ncbi:hypothetical protein [Mesomycoplasma lagogenitalium]|uniref:Uncharacterized protein n=1 Tax=Mesomycoplasma lagogenitalium TaxID=171286 RepID=A0ABY8LTA7_9BACT|nr:hypothetical protein [Mesomycoplasma lagogenitalium]WGI36472.1 hypothetical protein QEG99_03335 [Mesomycoplasma lagogenitalium]
MNHFLDKFIIKGRPLKAKHKKIITFTLIFLAFVAITLTLLFLPIKNGSTIENIISEFASKDWNSKTIIQIVGGLLTWLLIVWNLTMRIMDTLLYKKKKKLFERELKLHNELNILDNKGDKLKLTFKEHEKYVENTLSKIITAALKSGTPLRGVINFEIREILENLQLKRKEKTIKINELLTKYGVDTQNKDVKEALKQV